MMKEVYIVSAVRTPIGSFGGSLASKTATDLGAVAIQGALARAQLAPQAVEEVYMGNVLSAGLGQAPARQAARKSGLSDAAPCTTVNKVCASGMKSVMLAAQSMMLGHQNAIVAGGMESMSNVPYYVPKARHGYRYGHGKLLDGLLHDGLWEAHHQFPMGSCADHLAKEMNISREAQDEYAIASYEKVADAVAKGYFKHEIVPVEIPQRKGDPKVMTEDEEYKNVNFEKIPKLKAVFNPEGTVTAANASTINDGASALLLMSGEQVKTLGLKPLAKIRGFADAAQAPLYFTTSPALAIPKALSRAGVSPSEVDYYEINEAFALVALANIQKLELAPERVNAFGGAVALGHPIGCSGARIITTLATVLQQKGGRIGVAGICNGGGGASAIVIEKV